MISEPSEEQLKKFKEKFPGVTFSTDLDACDQGLFSLFLYLEDGYLKGCHTGLGMEHCAPFKKCSCGCGARHFVFWEEK